MPDKTYRINPAQNIPLQFNDALQDIVVRHVAQRIREKVGKDIDREFGKIFRFIASRLLSQRASPAQVVTPLKPYVPGGWEPYADSYLYRKHKRLRHLRWFVHGAPHNSYRQGEEQLVEELQNIDAAQVLNVIGSPQVVVRRDKSGITLKMLPKVRLNVNGFEAHFDEYLSDIALDKLRNRKRRYRALVGPAFAYYLDQRIPEIVTNSLKRL